MITPTTTRLGFRLRARTRAVLVAVSITGAGCGAQSSELEPAGDGSGSDDADSDAGDSSDDDDAESTGDEDSEDGESEESSGDDDDDDDGDDDDDDDNDDDDGDDDDDTDSTTGCEGNADCTEPDATICDVESGDCVKCGAEGTTEGCEDEEGKPMCNDAHECVASPREVMSWIAAYNIPESKATLEGTFGPYQAKDALTHIGLQFWVPTETGDLKIEEGVSDEDIRWFVDWGDDNDVKILLTVFNYTNDWDWPLAKSAFGPENRENFVNSLVAEADKWGLHGVDLDVEGNELPPDDGRADFKELVIALSSRLRSQNKALTVCTFSNLNADNMPDESWFPDWAGLIDYIHIMGYWEMYENAEDETQAYSWQQDYGAESGYLRSQVSMGLPASDQWGDGPALQHLTECVAAPKEIASICIWELSLDSFWRNEAHWEKMVEIKG